MGKDARRLPAWLLGLLLAIVIFALGLIVINALGFGDDPVIGSSDQPAAGSADTDGVSITYFDGTSGSFQDFRGKPVVLNFWASWCPACVAEMPDFQSVHSALGEDVQFVGANVQEISAAAANSLVRQTGVTYHLIEDPDGELYAFFGGISMPTTVFIDSAGNVVDTHSGAIFQTDLQNRIIEAFDL